MRLAQPKCDNICLNLAFIHTSFPLYSPPHSQQRRRMPTPRSELTNIQPVLSFRPIVCGSRLARLLPHGGSQCTEEDWVLEPRCCLFRTQPSHSYKHSPSPSLFTSFLHHLNISHRPKTHSHRRLISPWCCFKWF